MNATINQNTRPRSTSMEKILTKALHRLAEVTPDQSPIVSCFVNLDESKAATLQRFDLQAREIVKRLRGQRQTDFEDAFLEIRNYLENSLAKNSRGAAIYARWGERPFLIPLEFSVPLESRLVIDTLPHLYPVIETKDTYHRFVIAIVTENEARIVETVVGSVTQEIFTKRPELRERLGREWTRERYQNHRSDRANRFVQQKIEILEDLMKQRGHNHLVVAGSPKMVARLTKTLPPKLAEKLLTTLHTNPNSGVYPIVVEAVEAFVAFEHLESHDRVSQLESALLSGGLAVVGSEASRKALMEGYADTLIIDQDLQDPELREELVRLATQNEVTIETVKNSETLERLSGIGCLLRYKPHNQVDWELSAS